ncbi:MAG TPA: hypothetical protein VGR53_05580 [Nitrososphaerales archaeon]|nr:hypothetical protein [Nitrososphaerales archaeon]
MSFFEHFRAFAARVRCSELYRIAFVFGKVNLLHAQFATQVSSAPETNHAVKATIDIALESKRKKEAKSILFKLSGHGLLD